MKTDQIWPTTLGEVRLCVSRSFFDAALRGSRAVYRDDGTLTVTVNCDPAQLAQITPMIERTISRLAGRQMAIEFVQATSAESERSVETFAPAPSVVPEYDVHAAGWFPVAEYENRFWAPYLGRVAWRVWEIVRQADKRKVKTEWTPARRWTAPELAEMVPCGRQAIIGVARVCAPDEPGAVQVDEDVWRKRYPGAFDKLQDTGVAVISRQGEKRHTSYWIVVRVQLGLLSGDCVRMLPGRIQVRHDRWLEAHGFDPSEWNGNGSNGAC
jgi:hypothetical protein